MGVNTTNSVRSDVPKGHVINTVENTLEPPALQYTDEEDPEPVFVVPGSGWAARIAGANVSVVLFVVEDSGRSYGVGVGDDGRIDISESLEDREGFETYIKEDS